MKANLLLAAFLLSLAACSERGSAPSEISANQMQHHGVFGGNAVDPQEVIARTTVAVVNPSVGYMCTGSLLGNNMVLTAGHCLQGPSTEIIIKFGVNVKKPVTTRRVVSAQRHVGYNSKASDQNRADIALLKYEGTLPEGFKSVNVLSKESYKVLTAKTEIIAAGYGLRIPGLKWGSGGLRQVKLEIENPEYSTTEIQVRQTMRKGVCSGDSGGPGFIRDDNGVLYLWGITATGASNFPNLNPCSRFSIFTRVDAYWGWIQQTALQL